MKAGDLDGRQYTAHNQRGRNKISLLIWSQVGCIGENDGRSDDTSQHSKRMLETKEKSQEYWHAIMEAKKGCCSTLLLHERKVGLEQESIVVGANESLSAFCQSSIRQSVIEEKSYLEVKALPKRLHFSPKLRLGAWSGPMRSAIVRS